LETATAISPASGIGRAQWRVIILSSLGGALEFYDFVIYSMFAQYIGAAFFPTSDPRTTLLLSFSVFAAGYIARPVGGVILSHFGDRYGRRRVFIAAILTMSLVTIAMGLLPTKASIGITASVLMVCLRLLQGFSLGGELPGAITYVVETAPRTAGFAAGFIFFCVNTGVALASGLNLAVREFLDEHSVAQWGWRLGFLFGGLFGLVSFWLRLSLQETAEFQRMRHQASRRPFVDLMSTHPVPALVGIAALTATAGFNGLLFAMPSFLPTYMGYSPLEASEAQYVCLMILSFGLVSTAWLGDRVPRRWLLCFGSLLMASLAIPFFNAAVSRSMGLIPLFALAGVAASFINGPMCAVVADIFPTRVRFSGIAVSFNLAFSIFSGLAPFLANLMARAGNITGAAYYMCGCALLTFISTLVLHRYDGRILQEQAAAASAPGATSLPVQ
jgi:MFS transporter, MHS family, proline/betaine transporter